MLIEYDRIHGYQDSNENQKNNFYLFFQSFSGRVKYKRIKRRIIHFDLFKKTL